MSFTKKSAAVALSAAALVVPLLIAPTANAAPMSGSCSGGVISFDTSPLGLVPAPTTAAVGGNFNGCQGTPAPGGNITANFVGDGSCLDVNGRVDGVLNWSNGEASTVSGPWRVPGGVGAPQVNTVAITSGPGAGGQLTVDQGPVDGVPMTGPCLVGAARHASLPINGLQVN